jgi:predicted ribonuclease toxin of YeeF-YezG toxin-antitoxin module
MTVAIGLRTTLASAVRSKAAAVVLATVVGVGTIGAGTAAAAANGAFGQQVKAKVESCKDALAKGTHGIGDCVSDFTTSHNHGDSVSDTHNTHSNTGTHSNEGNHGKPTATPSHGKGH